MVGDGIPRFLVKLLQTTKEEHRSIPGAGGRGLYLREKQGVACQMRCCMIGSKCGTSIVKMKAIAG